MTDQFELKNGKAVYNGNEYDFDKLPKNVVFDGNINLCDKNLPRLPNMSTWIIKGYFDCENSNLTSLKGCPKEVGNFWCSFNNLTSLKGCPEEVDGWFFCCNNNLTSLKYCPERVGGDFSCSENNLTSLEHCPKEVGGCFYCYGNKIKTIDSWPEKIGEMCYYDNNPIKSIKKGILPLKYLIEFYKENIPTSRKLLMKELGVNTEEGLNTYLLMLGEI